MIEHLRDLFAYTHWADALHWKTIEDFPPALNDEALINLLHHIHLVQHAYLSLVTGEIPHRTKPGDFATPILLKEYARHFHSLADIYFEHVTESQLTNTITVPWFRDPSFTLTVEQALLQVAMHSLHHRAQNAKRLRELGGIMPVTDYVIWLMQGRPAPEWS